MILAVILPVVFLFYRLLKSVHYLLIHEVRITGSGLGWLVFVHLFFLDISEPLYLIRGRRVLLLHIGLLECLLLPLGLELFLQSFARVL